MYLDTNLEKKPRITLFSPFYLNQNENESICLRQYNNSYDNTRSKEQAKIPQFSKQVRQNSIVLPSLWNLKYMLNTQHTMIQNSWPILKEGPEKILLTIAT